MLKFRGQLMMAPFTSQVFYIPHISEQYRLPACAIVIVPDCNIYSAALH